MLRTKVRLPPPRPPTLLPWLTEYCALDTGSKTVLTNSKPSDFPSALRQELQSKVKSFQRHNIQTESTVEETCPKCGRTEVKFTNVQLRGADEGSTIIYMCDCGNL